MQFTLDIVLSNLLLVRVWLSVFLYLSKTMAYLHLSIMNVKHGFIWRKISIWQVHFSKIELDNLHIAEESQPLYIL